MLNGQLSGISRVPTRNSHYPILVIRLYPSILPHNFTNEQVFVDDTNRQRFIATGVPISAATQYQPNPRRGKIETDHYAMGPTLQDIPDISWKYVRQEKSPDMIHVLQFPYPLTRWRPRSKWSVQNTRIQTTRTVDCVDLIG